MSSFDPHLFVRADPAADGIPIPFRIVAPPYAAPVAARLIRSMNVAALVAKTGLVNLLLARNLQL
jgi:hypothetical protein